VKRLFWQNFNEGVTRGLGPVIINSTVFFYRYLMAATKRNNVVFAGWEIYVTNIRALAVKSTIAAGAAMTLLSVL